MVKIFSSNTTSSCFKRKNQYGQGMTEYVIVLTALIGIAATTPLLDELANLQTAINHKNKGYAYALSLSDYLDTEDVSHLTAKAQAEINRIEETANAFDDFTNGKIPLGIDTNGIPDIDLSEILKSML